MNSAAGPPTNAMGSPACLPEGPRRPMPRTISLGDLLHHQPRQ